MEKNIENHCNSRKTDKFTVFLKKTTENKVFNIFTGVTCLINVFLELYPLQELNNGQYKLPITLLYCRVFNDLVILCILSIYILDSEFNSKSIKYYFNSKSTILALIASIIGEFLSILILIITIMEVNQALIMILTVLCSLNEITVVIFLVQILFSNRNKEPEVHIALLSKRSTDVMIPADL